MAKHGKKMSMGGRSVRDGGAHGYHSSGGREKRHHEAGHHVADEKRRVPCCVYEEMDKHANLPTDVMMMDYPNFPSVPQRLDDSINYIDRQQEAGVKGMSKQILDKSY